MILLYTQFLLAGLLIAFLAELTIFSKDEKASRGQRFFMIVGWPVLIIIFIYYIIKEFFIND